MNLAPLHSTTGMMEYWNVEKTSESNNNRVTFFFQTTWSRAAIRRSPRQLVGIGFLASFGVGIGIGIGIDISTLCRNSDT